MLALFLSLGVLGFVSSSLADNNPEDLPIVYYEDYDLDEAIGLSNDDKKILLAQKETIQKTMIQKKQQILLKMKFLKKKRTKVHLNLLVILILDKVLRIISHILLEIGQSKIKKLDLTQVERKLYSRFYRGSNQGQ